MRGIVGAGTWFPVNQSTMWREILTPPVLYTNCRACTEQIAQWISSISEQLDTKGKLFRVYQKGMLVLWVTFQYISKILVY